MSTPERPVKQVIVIRKDLKMRRGKEIAQGAHAAMAFLTRMFRGGECKTFLTEAEQLWVEGSFRKITVRVSSEAELLDVQARAVAAGLETRLITDAGLTEFGGVPTHTALAIGPDYDELIDPITKDLEPY
jgi:peptidyl-tRNA hydrolase, PTH2 family